MSFRFQAQLDDCRKFGYHPDTKPDASSRKLTFFYTAVAHSLNEIITYPDGESQNPNLSMNILFSQIDFVFFQDEITGMKDKKDRDISIKDKIIKSHTRVIETLIKNASQVE